MNFMKHPHTEFSNTDLQQVTAMAVWASDSHQKANL